MMNKKMYNVAIVGATGAVGLEFLLLLKERNFPIKELRLLASKRSAGKKVSFNGKEIIVKELSHDSFSDIDIVLSSAGGAISKEFMPSAVKAGALVIDNTSYFRMHEDVPLVIPEINPDEIFKHKGIIANPNCSTIIMLLPLWPIHKMNPIKQVIVSTYQAASGAGAKAIEELIQESKAIIEEKPFERTIMPEQYAFNLFPHNSKMEEDGYCQEENKMINETRKILSDPNFKISPTCVRVPVLRAHSESIHFELSNGTDESELYEILKTGDGISVFEDRGKNRWAMPIDASGKDPVLVGRLRKVPSFPNSYELWVVGDQIRKGAALNAIQIAEHYINNS